MKTTRADEQDWRLAAEMKTVHASNQSGHTWQQHDRQNSTGDVHTTISCVSYVGHRFSMFELLNGRRNLLNLLHCKAAQLVYWFFTNVFWSELVYQKYINKLALPYNAVGSVGYVSRSTARKCQMSTPWGGTSQLSGEGEGDN